MNTHVQRVRDESVVPLRAPARRPLTLRIGALVVFLSVLYCPPRKRKEDESQVRRAGLYPELAAFGIRHGDCPAVQDRVARTVALAPSINAARVELRRQGIVLDKKTVRRIAETAGREFLAFRRSCVVAWQLGETPAGNELAGCRVAVQIDGGRIRIRENKPTKGRKKKGQRPTFRTPWREPKVMTIYVFNKAGKMERLRRPLIDGTLQGPDHLAELVAFPLHALGASKAEVVVFVSDGAPWIWDRLDGIIARAGLDRSRTVQVLDWYHAVSHVSQALTLLKLPERERRRQFVAIRTLLKQSRHEEVVAELERLAAGKSAKHKVWTEIRYLKKHGDAGHLQYLTFKRRGLPFGSGAVESAIRRVINLRLKSNSMYWRAENAEAIFALRAALLTDRWEDTLHAVQTRMTSDASLDWEWQPTSGAAPSPPQTPPAPEPPTTQALESVAA